MKNKLLFLLIGMHICGTSDAFSISKEEDSEKKNVSAKSTFACSVTAGASSTTINENQTTELTYTGCDGGTVNWTSGSTSVGTFVSPITTTTYTANCNIFSPTEFCTSDVTITVIPCIVTPSASPSSIFNGSSSILSYTGCETGTVTWESGAGDLGTGNSFSVTPSTTTTYTARCKLDNTSDNPPCTATVMITVSAIPPCAISASASPTNINSGQSSTLSYSGCSGGSVTWNNGAGSENNVSVSPTNTTTYTATCSPSGGGTTCTSDVTVNVAAACQITAFANPNVISLGQSSTLGTSGCTGTVSWDNGLGTGSLKTVSPITGTTYTATCTLSSTNYCMSSTSVTVNPIPLLISNVNIKTPVCIGSKSGGLEVFLDRPRVAGEAYSTLVIIRDNKFVAEYSFLGSSVKTPDIFEAGSYYLIVKNFTAGGAPTALADKSVDLLNPIGVSFSLNKTDVKCYSGNDGTIQIAAQGGTGNY